MSDDAPGLDRMLARHLEGRGIRDPRVLDAMRAVPRAEFVPRAMRPFACDDRALPIGAGQTISQPYMVALMAEALALRGGETVLEIGTGSGYAAAVLARLCARVHSIERIASLAAAARQRLARLGADNVSVHVGDGTLGWPEAAPYDAIVVTAGGPEVPTALRAQLVPGGRLVMPVGRSRGWQTLLRLTLDASGRLRRESLGDVVFVPLLGAQGWPAP